VVHRPSIFTPYPWLIAAESTRHGGVSSEPYASLNLGLYTDDDPADIRENRRRFFGAIGTTASQVAGARQVHGCEVHYVEEPGQYEGYDALITDRPGLFLTVTVADCTPILLADIRRRSIAAIHAGWRGTIAGIVSKTMEAMRRHFGADPRDCRAYIGTCIDACSYEVDADVADHFDDPFRQWDASRGKFLVDLKAANRAQLIHQGVPSGQIEISAHDTVRHNEDFFSHRKEKGHTGRMLAGIGMVVH
jgi:YfiH family protein